MVFVDPPYALADDELRAVLADLRGTAGWPTARVVVVERATRGGELAWPAGFEADRVAPLRRDDALVRSRRSRCRRTASRVEESTA